MTNQGTILVVDDTPANLKLLADSLATEGYLCRRDRTHLTKSQSLIGKTDSGGGSWFNQYRRKAPFAGLMLLVAGGVGAADAGSPSTRSVADLSLEDLVNVKVTSVSKKEEKLNDAAAKEMGGSLTVHSDGPGQGAVFTLELPCPPREDSHE